MLGEIASEVRTFKSTCVYRVFRKPCAANNRTPKCITQKNDRIVGGNRPIIIETSLYHF